MLQGVISQKVTRIAKGHLTGKPQNLRNARTDALVGMALPLAQAQVEPSAAAGVLIGTQGSAQRVFLSHARADEGAADPSGLRYMASAGTDPNGLVGVLDIYRGQKALSQARQEPNTHSRPVTQDWPRAARGHAAAHGNGVSGTDANSAFWYLRARAKLSAQLRDPGFTLRRVKRSDTSDAAFVARAVANHKAHKASNSKALEALKNSRSRDSLKPRSAA